MHIYLFLALFLGSSTILDPGEKDTQGVRHSPQVPPGQGYGPAAQRDKARESSDMNTVMFD